MQGTDGRDTLGCPGHPVQRPPRACRSVLPPAPGAADLLLAALVTRYTEGYAASVAPLSRALRAFAEPDGGGEDRRWLWLACRFAQDLWDEELWHTLATGGVRLARDTGALHLLPNSLNYLAALNVHSGRLHHRRGAGRGGPCDHPGDRAPRAPVRGGHAGRGARRPGAAAGAGRRRPAGTRSRTATGRRSALHLLVRRVDAQRPRPLRRGATAARRACEHVDVVAYGWALVELIEAGVRGGQAGRGRRGTRAPERTHARERHRRGARDRGALPCAAERRRVPSTASRSSGSRAAARRSSSRAAGSCTASGSGVRTGARTRASRCAPPTRASARWGLRRSPSVPAASCSPRRDRAPDHPGDARRPDAAGDPGRAAGPRGAHQPGDRRPAVHQPAHGRVPPPQGVPQARRQRTEGASSGATGLRLG